MTTSRTPTLGELLNLALDRRLSGLHTAMPARVERYDPTTQVVDVLPLLKQTYRDESDTEQVESWPVISNVPLVFPGAGGFRLTFPIGVGDTVLLIFAERSIDKWKTLGGEVDPVDLRTHDITDAVAIPGLHPANAPWTGASTTSATLGKDGGPQVEISATSIKLAGGTAKVGRVGDKVAIDGIPTPLPTLPVPLTGNLFTWITQVTAAINALAPSSVTAVPLVAGTISEGADKVTA